MGSIGVVGCGAIGKALLKAFDAGKLAVSVAGVTSRTEASARAFLSTLGKSVPYLDRASLIARSDLVVEAAGEGGGGGLGRGGFAPRGGVVGTRRRSLFGRAGRFVAGVERRARGVFGQRA